VSSASAAARLFPKVHTSEHNSGLRPQIRQAHIGTAPYFRAVNDTLGQEEQPTTGHGWASFGDGRFDKPLTISEFFRVSG
jgi:hypothetical protein